MQVFAGDPSRFALLSERTTHLQEFAHIGWMQIAVNGKYYGDRACVNMLNSDIGTISEITRQVESERSFFELINVAPPEAVLAACWSSVTSREFVTPQIPELVAVPLDSWSEVILAPLPLGESFSAVAAICARNGNNVKVIAATLHHSPEYSHLEDVESVTLDFEWLRNTCHHFVRQFPEMPGFIL